MRKFYNIEDRRGQSSYNSSFSSVSSGGNVLLGLIFSRLGWKGKLLVLVLLVAFGVMSNLGGLLSPSTGTNPYQS
ncbi:neutral zinc metallopeptidase, partial [Streptococcus suis]